MNTGTQNSSARKLFLCLKKSTAMNIRTPQNTPRNTTAYQSRASLLSTSVVATS